METIGSIHGHSGVGCGTVQAEVCLLARLETRCGGNGEQIWGPPALDILRILGGVFIVILES